MVARDITRFLLNVQMELKSAVLTFFCILCGCQLLRLLLAFFGSFSDCYLLFLAFSVAVSFSNCYLLFRHPLWLSASLIATCFFGILCGCQLL